MLLTIHNLPSNTRYVDVKLLIQEKCGLTELIFDNLVSDGNSKKVTVGVADEGDAAILVRKINGLYLGGLQLYVEDKRKKRESDQPYRSSASINQERQAVVPPQNPMVDAGAMNNAMMGYNMPAMYMPMQMPMMPMDPSMPYMGYGGYMGMPGPEARAPPPANDRGLGGAPGTRQDRDREAPRSRESRRPRDRKRRASPERPSSNSRPSRWSASNDAPPRKHKTPPRQPWPAREAPRRTDPQWQPREPEPRWEAPRREPEPGRPWQAEPERAWQPEPERTWQPEPERTWQPEPERAWQPPPERAFQPEPERPWQPEPERAWQPEPERAWQPEPERNFQPERERAWSSDRERSWQPERRPSPVHVMNDDRRRFNDWEGGLPRERGGHDNGQGPFEPADRRFEGHASRSEFRSRSRERPVDRERRNRREEPWHAPDGFRDGNTHAPVREESANWTEPRGRPPVGPPRGKANNQRPNPPKRPLDQPRGPPDWTQIANDYPATKKPKLKPNKQGPAQRNNIPPPKPLHKALPTPRPPVMQSTLADLKPKRATNIINKDQTTRGQAAAQVYKQILSMVRSSKKEFLHGEIVKELRTCVRSRIDVMLGEEMTNSADNIVLRYRKKYTFNDDKSLYNSMKSKIMQQKGVNKEDGTGVKIKTEKSDTDVKVKTDNIQNKSAAKPKPKPKPAAEKNKLPRHAMTDKQIITEAKKLRKVEFTQQGHYKMDPIHEKIMDEELAKISEIFRSTCASTTEEEDEDLYNRAVCQSLPEFEQSTRVHLSKRILNIAKGLAIRIFAEGGKLPKKSQVLEYLKPYRIDRCVVKKNKRGTMLVANLHTFEDYDHLCSLQNVVIDNVNVTIRNMYLLAPPPKLTKNQIKQRRQQFIESQIDKTTDYIIPPDAGNTETETQEVEPNTVPKNDVVDEMKETEDFAADDFDGIDFAADDGEAQDDPEGLNIADIREEDLEDF